jgi:universal stress protein A
LRYRHILSATDFSPLGDEAVRHAAELAQTYGARLTVVHVLPEPPGPSPLVPHYYSVQPDTDRMSQAKSAALAALAERIPQEVRDAGVEVDYQVCFGEAASELLSLDAKLHPELIVLGTYGRRGLSRWILGSVTQRVLSHAKADVLAIRER